MHSIQFCSWFSCCLVSQTKDFFCCLNPMWWLSNQLVEGSRERHSNQEIEPVNVRSETSALKCSLKVSELMVPPPEGALDWCCFPRPHLRVKTVPFLLTPTVQMGNIPICQMEVSIINQDKLRGTLRRAFSPASARFSHSGHTNCWASVNSAVSTSLLREIFHLMHSLRYDSSFWVCGIFHRRNWIEK